MFWIDLVGDRTPKTRIVSGNRGVCPPLHTVRVQKKETYQYQDLKGAVECKMWMKIKRTGKIHKKTRSETHSWSSGVEQEPCGHQEPHIAKEKKNTNTVTNVPSCAGLFRLSSLNNMQISMTSAFIISSNSV